MSVSALDIRVTRAKAGIFYLTVTKYDGSVQPLVGAVLWFHASVGGIVIDKSSPASGITITDAAGGLATLQLEPADTTALADAGIYIGTCELTLVSGGEPYPLNSGKITVTANVGTP